MVARYDPLLAWLPEADPTTPGVLLEIENLVPSDTGYAVAPQMLDENTSTAPGRVYAAGYIEFSGAGGYTSGNVIVSDRHLLYFRNGWETASPAMIALTTAAGYSSGWSFAAFQDWALAANASQGMLIAKTVQSTGTAGAFSTIAGAPASSIMVVASNFVLAFAIEPQWNEWRCSGINDPESWTLSAATQATSGQLVDPPGVITGAIEYKGDVIAFKDRGCLLGRYTGPPTIWSWTVLHDFAGCSSNDAIVKADDALYWIGAGRAWMYDGVSVREVPSFPRKWLLRNNGSPGSEAARMTSIRAGYQAANRQIVWYVCHGEPAVDIGYDTTTGASYPNLGMVYDVATDRWGLINGPVVTASCPSVAFDDSPAHKVPTGNTTSNYPLPGNIWFRYVDGNASAGAAAMQLSTYQFHTAVAQFGAVGDDGAVSVLRRVKPRFTWSSDVGTTTIEHRTSATIGARTTAGGLAMTISAAAVTVTAGRADLSHAAHWHSVKLTVQPATPESTVPAYFELAGMWYDLERQGER